MSTWRFDPRDPETGEPVVLTNEEITQMFRELVTDLAGPMAVYATYYLPTWAKYLIENVIPVPEGATP